LFGAKYFFEGVVDFRIDEVHSFLENSQETGNYSHSSSRALRCT